MFKTHLYQPHQGFSSESFICITLYFKVKIRLLFSFANWQTQHFLVHQPKYQYWILTYLAPTNPPTQSFVQISASVIETKCLNFLELSFVFSKKRWCSNSCCSWILRRLSTDSKFSGRRYFVWTAKSMVRNVNFKPRKTQILIWILTPKLITFQKVQLVSHIWQRRHFFNHLFQMKNFRTQNLRGFN